MTRSSSEYRGNGEPLHPRQADAIGAQGHGDWLGWESCDVGSRPSDRLELRKYCLATSIRAFERSETPRSTGAVGSEIQGVHVLETLKFKPSSSETTPSVRAKSLSTASFGENRRSYVHTVHTNPANGEIRCIPLTEAVSFSCALSGLMVLRDYCTRSEDKSESPRLDSLQPVLSPRQVSQYWSLA